MTCKMQAFNGVWCGRWSWSVVGMCDVFFLGLTIHALGEMFAILFMCTLLFSDRYPIPLTHTHRHQCPSHTTLGSTCSPSVGDILWPVFAVLSSRRPHPLCRWRSTVPTHRWHRPRPRPLLLLLLLLSLLLLSLTDHLPLAQPAFG